MKLKINQQVLEEEILSLERWYVQSHISLIKAPVFIKQIEKEIKTTKDEEKAKRLQDMIEQNEIQTKWHLESIENLELILPEVYKLRESKNDNNN